MALSPILIAAPASRRGTEVFSAFSAVPIATATTTLVKSGGGLLKRIVVNAPVASATITVYDALTATGTAIAIITCDATELTPFFLDFDYAFTIGLVVVTSGATQLTVIAR